VPGLFSQACQGYRLSSTRQDHAQSNLNQTCRLNVSAHHFARYPYRVFLPPSEPKGITMPVTLATLYEVAPNLSEPDALQVLLLVNLSVEQGYTVNHSLIERIIQRVTLTF
jgi:hypothetical protein